MNKLYKQHIEKLKRFNSWEAEYLRSLSVQKKLEQFSILFNWALSFPEDTKNSAHEKHLELLISSSKRLKGLSR